MKNCNTYPFDAKRLASELKAAARSGRVICKKEDDNFFYVVTSCFGVRLHAVQYDALVRPVFGRDPGDWTIDSNGYRPEASFNPEKFFDRKENAAPLRCTGLSIRGSKGRAINALYCKEKDFAALIDETYMSILQDTADLLSDSPVGMIQRVAEIDGAQRVIAIFCPVKIDATQTATVRTYCGAAPTSADVEHEKAKAARKEATENAERAEKAEAQAAEQSAEIERLRAEIAALKEAQAATVQATPAAAPVDHAADAEAAAEKFRGISGLEIEIKGARTAAPVVWIGGEIKKHKKAIEAAGAKWSRKRAMYYYCA